MSNVKTAIKGSKGLYQRYGRIIIKFKYDGSTHEESTGFMVSDEAIAMCVSQLYTINKEIEQGVFDYPATFPDSKKAAKYGSPTTNITLEECARSWWGIWKTDNTAAKPNTIRDYNTCLERQIIDRLGDRLIHTISGMDLINWSQSLIGVRSGMPLTDSKKKNCFTVMHRIISHAEAAGFFKGKISPWGQFAAYKVSLQGKTRKNKHQRGTEELHPFTKAERSAIIEAIETDSERNMIGFNFTMGLRAAELIGLTWDDVDFDAGTIHVRRQKQAGGYERCKAGSDRVLDISAPAMEWLKKQKEFMLSASPVDMKVLENTLDIRGENMFTTEKGQRVVFFNSAIMAPYSSTTILGRRWQSILNAAGVKSVYIRANGSKENRGANHTRHTCASIMLTAGASFLEIARQLGNTEESARYHYACIIKQDRVDTKDRNQQLFADA